MVQKILGINQFMESSLFKIIVDRQGNIIEMTEAVKFFIDPVSHPSHLTEIFDQALLKQLEDRLLHSKSDAVNGHNVLTGYLLIPNKKREPCYIIYQQHADQAIITIKIGEQNDKLHQLYENAYLSATIPMALLNEWGFIISTNEQFTKSFSNKAIGEFVHLQDLFSMLTPLTSFSYKDFILQAVAKKFSHVNMSYTCDGIELQLEVLLQLDPQTDMYILRIVDITEKQRLFDQLAHSDQLCTTGEIAASIAHEVRNPMTTLKGFLQLLEHEVSGNALTYVRVIQDEVTRMNEILNEMLVLSKPVVDEVTIFSLSVLVEDVLLLLRPKVLIDQINLIHEFNATEPVLIQANPNRIKQVFINLLKNAMEAMDAQGTLMVTINEEEEGRVNIFISDTGVGMSARMLDNLFDPFVTDKEGGTGLGLPFVKKTIEEYGGNIFVSSEVGVGTIFHLSLPRMDAPPQV